MSTTPTSQDQQHTTIPNGGDSDHTEYAVDFIIAMRRRNGQVQYKVRWHGYDETDDTWEPLSNLTNCPREIQAFHLRLNTFRNTYIIIEATESRRR
jgi:hypothetical protein